VSLSVHSISLTPPPFSLNIYTLCEILLTDADTLFQDILPPAVQTELHELQPELVAAGQGQIGMPLKAFIDETWAALDRWDENEDEIMVKEVSQRWGHIDDEKKTAFKQLEAMMRGAGGPKA